MTVTHPTPRLSRDRSRDGHDRESRDFSRDRSRDLTRACGCTRPHPHPLTAVVEELSLLKMNPVGSPTTLELTTDDTHATPPKRGGR